MKAGTIIRCSEESRRIKHANISDVCAMRETLRTVFMEGRQKQISDVHKRAPGRFTAGQIHNHVAWKK